MWESIGNIWTNNIVPVVTSKNFGSTLSGVGALSQAYGGYKSAKATENYNNNLLNLQRKQQAYDMARADSELKRRDTQQNSLDNAINSVWGNPDEDEEI